MDPQIECKIYKPLLMGVFMIAKSTQFAYIAIILFLVCKDCDSIVRYLCASRSI